MVDAGFAIGRWGAFVKNKPVSILTLFDALPENALRFPKFQYLLVDFWELKAFESRIHSAV
jgi:hypothetical protein